MEKTEIEKLIDIAGEQKDLAEALGVSESAVSKWVSKGYLPTDRALDAFEVCGDKKTSAGEAIHLVSLLDEARKVMREDKDISE